jgi:hypothetical protein
MAAIEKLLEKLPMRDRQCVEFGAANGLDSTTRELILNQGYSAVLIEGKEERFAELQKNYAGNNKVIARHGFVGFTAEDGLDAILRGTPVPQDFDFLSVDIDGNDYHVWNAITKYRPKIVMIEYNPTIPPEVSFIQPANPSLNQGSSLAAMVELGKSKGYELVAVLSVNAFFVTKELYPKFGVADNQITSLWTKRDCVTYIFCGYDGQVFLRGSRVLPWHGVALRESKMQVLPALARGYPFTIKNRLVYAIMRPLQMVKALQAIKQVLAISFRLRAEKKSREK